ncbi:hypothetical protein ACF068_18310 [Streptomyces sp. NPDC016309]|uniref:hypothetical protein n=1 Tax=Streptomyces sp. NPDC016309 TaxID=3364965 RepID=UPI0036F72063
MQPHTSHPDGTGRNPAGPDSAGPPHAGPDSAGPYGRPDPAPSQHGGRGSARRRGVAIGAVAAATGWLAVAATLLPGGSPLRWAPVLLFVTFGPGLALLHPQPPGLRPGARLEALALAAPLSLSSAALTATALFLVRGFSATAFLLALAAFATVAAALPGVPLPAATRGAAGRATSGGGDG